MSAIELARQREQYAVRMDLPRGKNRQTYDLKEGDQIHGFTVTEITRVDDFDINAYKLTHDLTGLQWLHMDCAD